MHQNKPALSKFRAAAAVIMALVSSLVTYIPVLAISSSDFKTMNGINYYDSSGTTPAICSGGAGSLTGSSGEDKVWNFLIQKGLTKEQAAGIAGNLSIESGFIPDNQENSQSFPAGGWGIAQWTGSRRTDLVNALQKAGLPYTNEKTPPSLLDKLLLFELNYMWNEADSRGDLNKLRTDTAGQTGNAAVSAAAVSWHRYYEISADLTPTARINRSLEIYARQQGGVAVTASPASGCGASIANNVVYYSQYDPAYASQPYGTSTIDVAGCGPTSLAMAISTLSGKTVTPTEVANFGKSYYVSGAGSSHDLFAAAATNWGLKSAPIGKDEAAVQNILNKGGLVIAAGTGAYPYTTAGHIFIIRGTTPDGKYLISNPLPLGSDLGKSSADVLKNTAWYSRAYSWGEVGVPAVSMYSITK